jgi:hypothetical protein
MMRAVAWKRTGNELGNEPPGIDEHETKTF